MDAVSAEQAKQEPESKLSASLKPRHLTMTVSYTHLTLPTILLV